MKISYTGEVTRGKGKGRCAVIEYTVKEEDKAADILEAIEKEGYTNILRWGDDEYNSAYISVFDREEFEEVKEIYLNAKRKK